MLCGGKTTPVELNGFPATNYKHVHMYMYKDSLEWYLIRMLARCYNVARLGNQSNKRFKRLLYIMLYPSMSSNLNRNTPTLTEVY